MEINNLSEDDVLDIVKDAVSSNLIPVGSWCEDGSIRQDIKTLREDIDEIKRIVDALSSLAVQGSKDNEN
jgi:archaellum component FlaC